MNCTEIVNPFQGCASGFSPVMTIVKVFEDQKRSSTRRKLGRSYNLHVAARSSLHALLSSLTGSD